MGDDNTLFVAGLSNQVTEDHLYELFTQAGPLQKVSRPKDKDGSYKSFAFVEFSHSESVPYAIQIMEGVKLFNQYLRLKGRSGSQHDHNQHSPSPSHSSHHHSHHHHRSHHQDSPSRDRGHGSSRSDYHRSRSYHGSDERKKGHPSPLIVESSHTGSSKPGVGRSLSGDSGQETPFDPLTQPFGNSANFQTSNSSMQPQQSFEDRRNRLLQKQSMGSTFQAHQQVMQQGPGNPYGNFNFNMQQQQQFSAFNRPAMQQGMMLPPPQQQMQQQWFPNQQW